MGFLNNVMDSVAMNRLKYESEIVAATSICQIFGDEPADAHGYEDSSGECFYASYQVMV